MLALRQPEEVEARALRAHFDVLESSVHDQGACSAITPACALAGPRLAARGCRGCCGPVRPNRAGRQRALIFAVLLGLGDPILEDLREPLGGFAALTRRNDL
jgi:hypothetical protein